MNNSVSEEGGGREGREEGKRGTITIIYKTQENIF